MAKFNYTAINTAGQRIKGEREADNENDVTEYLYSQGLTIVSIEEKIGFDFSTIAKTEIGGLPIKEKVILVKQLATMISAGIPLLQAISILVDQAEKSNLKDKLERIYKMIQAGTALSEAFKKESGIFSEVQINLLSAGEKSGNLNEMLQKIAIDLEKSKNLRSKILGAMIYPVIIFVVIIVVLVVMMAFMIPQVTELYKGFGATELPFVTQVLVDVSNLFSNPITVIVLIILLVALFFLYRYYNATTEGRIFIDRMKLRVPVFGKLIQNIEIAEFCRLTAMLIESGLPILEVLEIVAKASGNKLFANVLYGAKEELTKGSSLSLGMAKFNKYDVYPLILIKIISTGEESGKLDQVLTDMGLFYEAEVEQITSNLTKLMEPLILIIAGGMVAILAVGIYLPMYQLGQVVNT